MKIIKKILIVFLVVVLLLVGGIIYLYKDIYMAATSTTKLEENVYALEFKGDYGFSSFLKEGGASSDLELANYIVKFLSKGFYSIDSQETEKDMACSAFIVENENHNGYYFARNFDWSQGKVMIVHTKPKGAYESFSTCLVDFLGFGEDYVPEGIMNQMIGLASIYVPLDGMNEKGFMIADLLAGDKEDTHQESDKIDLTTVSALRYVLDYAATVDEAIQLFENIDYNSSMGYAHHFFMADASGDYAVIEYVDNQMVVTKSKLLTNHYLAKQKEGVGSQNSHLRFSIIQDALDKANHSMNINEVKQTINSVRVKNIVERTNIADNDVTLWQIVYDPTNLSATFYYNQNDEHPYYINLKETKWLK